jgi:hypothetical protein
MSYVQRRRFLWMVFLVGLAVLALTAMFTNATTLVRLRFQDLAQRSTAIARLRCIGSESRWDKGELWTETHFELIEAHKGLLPGFVTVRTLGGHDRHLRPHVDGMPVFTTGEEVAEPLDGVVSPAQINPAITSLCRNSTTDAGWPLLQDCVVPVVNIIFTTRT